MHRVAEAGVAAHWLYKSGGQLDLAEAQRETHRWLQSLLEIQSESRDSKEFLEHVKGDLFPDEIYLFTPKGKIMYWSMSPWTNRLHRSTRSFAPFSGVLFQACA